MFERFWLIWRPFKNCYRNVKFYWFLQPFCTPDRAHADLFPPFSTFQEISFNFLIYSCLKSHPFPLLNCQHFTLFHVFSEVTTLSYTARYTSWAKYINVGPVRPLIWRQQLCHHTCYCIRSCLTQHYVIWDVRSAEINCPPLRNCR